jgi:hypothetical protein
MTANEKLLIRYFNSTPGAHIKYLKFHKMAIIIPSYKSIYVKTMNVIINTLCLVSVGPGNGGPHGGWLYVKPEDAKKYGLEQNKK